MSGSSACDVKQIQYTLMLGTRLQGLVEDEYVSSVSYAVKQSDGTWRVRIKLKDDAKTLVVDESTYIFILNSVKRGDTLSIGRESKHIMRNHTPIPPMMPIGQYMTSLMCVFGVTAGALLLMLYLLFGGIS